MPANLKHKSVFINSVSESVHLHDRISSNIRPVLSTAIMSAQDETRTPIGGTDPSQIQIHAPQPINLAAQHRLQVVLELDYPPFANSSGLGDIASFVDASTPNSTSGDLTTTYPATPLQSVLPYNNLSESSPHPDSDTVGRSNTTATAQVGTSKPPEEITFWPGLKDYLDDPTLLYLEPTCMVCFDTVLVIGFNQVVKEDDQLNCENCLVLPCGHFIGDDCFGKYLSKHCEEMQARPQDNRVSWYPPLGCPICRTEVELRIGDCGHLTVGCRPPTLVEDNISGAGSSQKWSMKLMEICEGCLIEGLRY